MEKVIVRLENISKCFDENIVIKDISLDIYEGEFITFLGPSGCGKTTVLRMISGLELPSSGKVYIDDKDETYTDPTLREVNTIFQNFALFPHMTVEDNIAFGLKMKKMKKELIKKEVKKAIKLVDLDGLEKRYPKELSGGQQQRVAIARSIVMNPKVLLLDESLCSLDLKLKKKMQIELKKIQQKLGITFIYVTHNQDEALTMSDRIVIINKGKIEQVATPQEIYRNPKNLFVADFIGESNIYDGVVTSNKGKCSVLVEDTFNLTIKNKDDKYKVNDKIKVVIRPEIIDIFLKKGQLRKEGIIEEIIYDGSITKLVIRIENTIIKADVVNSVFYHEGDVIYFHIDKDYIITFKA